MEMLDQFNNKDHALKLKTPRQATAATADMIRRLVDQQWVVGQGGNVKKSEPTELTQQ